MLGLHSCDLDRDGLKGRGMSNQNIMTRVLRGTAGQGSTRIPGVYIRGLLRGGKM